MASRVDPELAREIADRLAALEQRVQRACARARRPATEVQLIGVSKRQPVERIVAAVEAGVTELGENYLQELREKQPVVREWLAAGPAHAARVGWRMIGGLQRNKAGAAVALCDAVDSVDRQKLAIELDRRAAAAERQIDICIQVNLSQEPQKSGVPVSELAALVESCQALPHLRVAGLMTVPAANADPEASRPAFAQLRELRDTLLPGGQLSMGMSADFEVAIEEGATLIRVGTALFGERTS